ncbi:MAG: beta-lactamase family protein [Lachnospiraceae bacterium]|nr:beta-lactamase family protein [Lachnospiraceae bacterium]
MQISESLLNNCLDNIISQKYVFSTVLRVESGDGSFSWMSSRGEMKPDSKYFIASVTKLYVTAVIMSLIEERKLSLDDKISKYILNDMERLHIYKGFDYSSQITVRHLISNTSGLPDYFTGSAFNLLLQGRDDSWGFEQAIQSVKQMNPKFAPGQKGKVAYSDTNYQILGKVIETVTEKEIDKVFSEYIFDKLGFRNTYVYKDTADNEPTAFYHKARKLWLPNYMASISVEGGIVSTAEEVMIFLKKFFDGHFFPQEKIKDLKKWNLLFPPPSLFYYGIGLEKQPTPRFISIKKPINEIIGFWGQTGSFAWYNSDTDLYFTGTANQANGQGHQAAGKAMFKIIKSVL